MIGVMYGWGNEKGSLRVGWGVVDLICFDLYMVKGNSNGTMMKDFSKVQDVFKYQKKGMSFDHWGCKRVCLTCNLELTTTILYWGFESITYVAVNGVQ